MSYTNYDATKNLERVKARYEYEIKEHQRRLDGIAKDRQQLHDDIAEIDRLIEKNRRSRNISVLDRNMTIHRLAELRFEAERRLVALDEAERRERRYANTVLAEQRRTLAELEFRAAKHAYKTRNDAFILNGGIAFPDSIAHERDKLAIGRAHLEQFEGYFQALKAIAAKDRAALEAALDAFGLTPEQYKTAFPLVSEHTLNGKSYCVVTQADGYTFVINALSLSDNGDNNGE